MSGDIGRWNYGLLFAALEVVLGIVGIVAAGRFSERWLARGLFLQGILLTFVVEGAFFRGRSDLKLGGLIVVGLLVVQCACGPNPNAVENPIDEEDPA